jgi:hypothetical protein
MDPSNAPFSSREIDLFQTEFEEESYATCARCSVLDTSCQKKGVGEGGQVDTRQMMDADAVLFTWDARERRAWERTWGLVHALADRRGQAVLGLCVPVRYWPDSSALSAHAIVW